jgi:hypothetical protein
MYSLKNALVRLVRSNPRRVDGGVILLNERETAGIGVENISSNEGGKASSKDSEVDHSVLSR